MLWLAAFRKVSSSFIHQIYPTHFPLLPLAPTLAEKRLEMLKEQERGVAGETAWMVAGLKLEEQQ
jgi:hypothetical protein